jgi:putative ABC transport system ATP-binding protein
MLYCLAGLLMPSSGRVLFRDRDLARLSNDARSDLRRQHFGFVFQFAELVPELSLQENISLPLELNGIRGRERGRRVEALLETLDLTAQAGRRPAKVSGGQAQRAAVARAIAHRPDVVFADEPTGALDSANGKLVLDALLSLSREHGTAVVLVTHDRDVAAWAERVLVMRDGRLVASE